MRFLLLIHKQLRDLFLGSVGLPPDKKFRGASLPHSQLLKLFVSICLFLTTDSFADTIGIFTYSVKGAKPWDPDTVQTGISGSEEAVIYISQELAKLNHQVIVFGTPPENSPYSSPEANPRFVSTDYKPEQTLDIAIAWRTPDAAKRLKNFAKKVYLWPHDTYHWQLPEEQIEAFDDVLWLASWQREQWISVNSAFSKFTTIIGNGIRLDQFEPLQERENPYACIYASNYARGLEHLLDIWPKIKKEFPKATLDIYYGWNHWGLLSPEKELKMHAQIDLLSSYGVKEHGQVGHEELNKAFAKASLWSYPCTAPECQPITALRAQYAGTMPVIIDGTGLTESVKSGYRCNNLEEYLPLIRKALSEAEAITPAKRLALRQTIEKDCSWAYVASQWDALFHRPDALEPPLTKTVFLTILARNKEHVLPKYLDCIEKLDYDKKLITVYINTNNNCDRTEEMLTDWAMKHKAEYHDIILETHHIDTLTATDPHAWTPDRFKIIATLRNLSLRKAKQSGCDYYFVADCDNFLTPCTLKELVKQDKPIIAPLLRSIPEPHDVYANYFLDVDERGYYRNHPDYFKVLYRSMLGTFKAPVVHCTYLIKSDYLDQLNYIDGTIDWEFIIFSRSARNHHIDQYICNEKVFGTQLHFNQNLSLEEEQKKCKEIFKALS